MIKFNMQYNINNKQHMQYDNLQQYKYLKKPTRR